MYRIFFILLLLSAALAEECNLFELCKEGKEEIPKCWPKSDEEMESFANQFIGFDDLKCVKDVLLNEALSFEYVSLDEELLFKVDIKQRIQDLSKYDCFKNMSDVLVEELYAYNETPEYLKMIPVATLCNEFKNRKDLGRMIELMGYQEYYYLNVYIDLVGFEEALLDSLNGDSRHKRLSWLTNPMWIAFAKGQPIEEELAERILKLFFIIGEEIKKHDTKDAIKAAFILTVSLFMGSSVTDNLLFFDNDERDKRNFNLLKDIAQSVADDQLRSVLELVPYCYKHGSKDLYAHAYENQGFHSMKILWNHLKSIGHKNNAAKLIYNQFQGNILSKRYVVLNTFGDHNGQEMFAALLNAASEKYDFFDVSDVVGMISGFEDKEMPAKIKTYHFSLRELGFVDFEHTSFLDPLLRNFGTEEMPVRIKTLMDQNPKDLEKSLNSLTDNDFFLLLIVLCRSLALPKNIRAWSRTYSVCSALTKRLLSFEPSKYIEISHHFSVFYFLVPYIHFNALGPFDDNRGSLASAYLLSSGLLQTRVQTLEWLFNVRRAVSVLFQSNCKITGAHAELIWTFRLILDEFIKELELLEDGTVERKERDSYILKMLLQDFGPHAEVFYRKDLNDMPLKWTLSIGPFMLAQNTIALAFKTRLDNNSEKIPLIKVVKTLAKHLDDKLKWEHITDYLKHTDLDFIAVKEIANEILNGISARGDWNSEQKELVTSLFACYHLDFNERSECRERLASKFRQNTKLISDLTKFVSFSFVAWMPCPYKNIKKFYSTIVRDTEGDSKLPVKMDNYLPSFEDVLQKHPYYLAELDSSIGYLYNFSDQYIQDFVKGLLDEQLKLFKKTETGSYIPAWALGKGIGKTIGMLLGKCILNSIPFSVSFDSIFLSLLLGPSDETIKKYYKAHYTEDFNNYASPIRSLGEEGLQKGFDKLLVPESCNVKCTTIDSVSNLLLPDPDSQMKTIPSWDYLITDYLDSIDSKMELAFYHMVLEMRKGLLMSLDKKIWSRIQKIQHVEDLLRVWRKNQFF